MAQIGSSRGNPTLGCRECGSSHAIKASISYQYAFEALTLLNKSTIQSAIQNYQFNYSFHNNIRFKEKDQKGRKRNKCR
jgi:hypothetical protein